MPDPTRLVFEQTLTPVLELSKDGKVVSVNRAAKKVFAHMHTEGVGAEAAIAATGLGQINDPDELRPVVQAVVDAHPEAAADYQAGVTKAFHALKGRVMRDTGGRANPGLVDTLLRALLDA